MNLSESVAYTEISVQSEFTELLPTWPNDLGLRYKNPIPWV